jgi:FixJ family two-component response regulator
MGASVGTVYVVDDDKAFRGAVKSLLNEEGFSAEAFEDGELFLNSANWDDVGCLLLDIRMPKISGLEVQFKLDEVGFRLPIVFLTGHGDVPTAVQAMKMGAFDFVEKPFQNDSFVKIVRSAIELSNNSSISKAEEHMPHITELTKRENDVFRSLVRGLTNKATAVELELSQRTIEFHRSNILQKLNARSVADLIVKSKRR